MDFSLHDAFSFSLEFKPIQFPEPVKYDESNVMRGPALSYQSRLPSSADPLYQTPADPSYQQQRNTDFLRKETLCKKIKSVF
jgi:hypothetical protein